MALTIRNPRAKNLAKELAASRHITMTQAVIEALSNELERERQKFPSPNASKPCAKPVSTASCKGAT